MFLSFSILLEQQSEFNVKEKQSDDKKLVLSRHEHSSFTLPIKFNVHTKIEDLLHRSSSDMRKYNYNRVLTPPDKNVYRFFNFLSCLENLR